MKLKPLQDWAVIQKEEPEERTAGGIIIPDAAKDKPTRGVVLAIGPGRFKDDDERKSGHGKKEKKFIPTTLRAGQRILYGKYSAREFDVDGETFTLVREEDVLGILEISPATEVNIKAEKDSTKKKASPVKKTAKKTEAAEKNSVKTGKKKEPASKKK
jgi:chaperonin GroES